MHICINTYTRTYVCIYCFSSVFPQTKIKGGGYGGLCCSVPGFLVFLPENSVSLQLEVGICWSEQLYCIWLLSVTIC